MKITSKFGLKTNNSWASEYSLRDNEPHLLTLDVFKPQMTESVREEYHAQGRPQAAKPAAGSRRQRDHDPHERYGRKAFREAGAGPVYPLALHKAF